VKRLCSALFAVVLLSTSVLTALAQASAASSVIGQLHNTISTITLSTDYTVDSDPEGLLGLPGQYTAKAKFADGDTTGMVEVFGSQGDLNNRYNTLEANSDEVDVKSGVVLVRLFGYGASSKASEYGAALGSVVLS
jgi:hypothetical protein